MLKNVDKYWIGGNSEGNFSGKDKDAAKFNRMAKIQKKYSDIDAKLRKFCEVEALTERKACAFAVLMMIECGIRIGNQESSDGYVSKAKKTEGQVLKTYGLTTLLKEHISFKFSTVSSVDYSGMVLNFIGKKSVEHDILITDPFLIKIGYQFYKQSSNRWLSLPDNTEIQDKTVNNFIKKSIGNKFTAKDFRTFRANIEAAKLIEKTQKKVVPQLKKKEVNEEIKKIVTDVSLVLGNSPAIAKKAYINPEILRKHWNVRGFDVEIQRKNGKVKETITKKDQI